MFRSIRRQFRLWKQDFLSIWSRLTTFHRVLVGITLAAIILVPSPKHVIDPVKAQIAEVEEGLEESECPETVTLPEEDVDSQELQLKIESFEESMPKYRAQRDEAVGSWPDFSKANRGAILAEFNDLITQSNLIRLEFHEGEAPVEEEKSGRSRRSSTPEPEPEPATEGPLETAVHSYVLAGTFDNIRSFLAAADRFAYPARIETIRLELPGGGGNGEPAPAVRRDGPPEIQLSFCLKLFFRD